MEAVLEWYDESAPLPEDTIRFTFDEKPCQLLDEKVEPLMARPGSIKKVDHEYVRKGTANVLLAYNVDTGQRHAQVRQQRTKKDFAQFIDGLVEKHCPMGTKKVEILLDNLNTHTYGAFYENLPLARAEELRHLVKFIYTPKHGSWLNVTEIEFSALAIQCLGKRRISDLSQLGSEVLAWETYRNEARVRVKWTFTKSKARDKFSRHYAKLHNPTEETSGTSH